MTLFASNTGSNTFAASLGDVDPADPTSLTITGSVSWVMSGNSYSNESIVGGSPWVFTGSNTYTGPTNVLVGTLQIGNGGTTGSIAGAVNLSNSAVLAFNRGGSLTYGGAISGNGSIVNQGPGLLTLTGSNTFSQGATLSNGTTAIVGGTSLGAGTVTLQSAATLQLGGNSPYTVANAISISDTSSCTLNVSNAAGVTLTGPFSGFGGVQVAGGGLLNLGGPIAVSGGLTISSGTVQVGAGGSIGGSIVNNAALVFNRPDNFTFTGDVTGSGSLTQAGAGVLSISSTQGLTGPVTISRGTLRLTPLATPSGMSLWLDANTGVVTAGSNSVYQWTDQSGFGNNATQTNQALTPTYGTNALLGGKPVLTFNGTNSSLNVNLNFMTHGVPYTIFSVEGNTAYSGQGFMLGSGGPGTYDSGAPFVNRTLYFGYGQAGQLTPGPVQQRIQRQRPGAERSDPAAAEVQRVGRRPEHHRTLPL